MILALRSGQPFGDVLTWHPRDVDTCMRLLLDDVDRNEQDARDARFAAASLELRRQMGG